MSKNPVSSESASRNSAGPPPEQAPSAALWIVCGVVFMTGSAFAVGLFFQEIIPSQQRGGHDVSTQCTVLETRVEQVPAHGVPSARASMSNHEGDAREFAYSPQVRIAYVVDGETYETWTFDGSEQHYAEEAEASARLAEFVPGETGECWYDPDDPRKAVVRTLEPGRHNYFGVIATGLLGAAGFAGLLHCAVKTIRATFQK